MVGYADTEIVVRIEKGVCAMGMTESLKGNDVAIQLMLAYADVVHKREHDGREGICEICTEDMKRVLERAQAKPKEEPAPRHAFEVNLSIGSCEWDHVLECVDEMRRELESHGPECRLTSGGWRGCMSIDIQRREVTPDDYRKELSEWFDRTRDAKRPSA